MFDWLRKKRRASSNTDTLQGYPRYPFGVPLPTEDHPGIQGYTPNGAGPHLPLTLTQTAQVGVPRWFMVQGGQHDVVRSGEEYYAKPLPNAPVFTLAQIPGRRVKGVNVPIVALVERTAAYQGSGINHVVSGSAAGGAGRTRRKKR